MSKIETTSKVSLALEGKARTCANSPPPPPHPHPKQPGKGYPQANKDPWLPQEPLITPSGLQNGNHRLCLKSKPQVKCHWSLPAG